MSASGQSNSDAQRYLVSYTYDAPGPAGPFKGRMEVNHKYNKGDTIRAMFGAATVKSCRAVKP